MRDDLLLYYERELTYIRSMATQFAKKYPKVASRLVIEPDKCEDPHVERLLESFAFLAARVHLKIDDEFPEITESLLSIIYPHYIRPIPSMSIVEFRLDPELGKLTTGFKIDRGSVLYSKPVAGVPCKFRTCYDTTLWPLTVREAEWKSPDRLRPALQASDSVAAIRLELQCNPDVYLSGLEMDELVFYLRGENQVVYKLYELLGSRLNRVVVRNPAAGPRGQSVTLPASSLEPMGFSEDETMLPHSRRSFLGYQFLQEYFSFPEKYLFFRLRGLDKIWKAGFQDRAEIIFLISRFEGEERRESLETGITASTFRLGCSPIVNLFDQTAEPLLWDQKKFEYPIIPDVHRPRALEIFSVDRVTALSPGTRETIEFKPFYALRPGIWEEEQKAFWIATRRPSSRPNDEGTEIYLSLLDASMRTVYPDVDTLNTRTTCTNRNLPAKLAFGDESGDFDLDDNGPVDRIVALVKPTAPHRPPSGKALHWRLISHLSLNYLSLVSEGKEALQQILKLYDFTNSVHTRQMVEGISGLRSGTHFSRLLSEYGITYARGVKVEIEFDEEQFVGGGVYMFANVLENFLAHYVTLNSFSQLVARTKQRKEVLHSWPPRSGRQILI